jgi:hypothetical protein
MRCASPGGLQRSQRRERAAGNREGIDDPQRCGLRPILTPMDGRRTVEDGRGGGGRSQGGEATDSCSATSAAAEFAYF